MRKNRPLLAYFGHHRCASTWIHHILRQASDALWLHYVAVYGPQAFNYDLQRFVTESQADMLTYGNADYQYVRQLDNFRGFHVVRDPRDVCASSYYSDLYSHPTDNWPELVEHRKKLQALPKDEGLLLDMEFVSQFMSDMYSWDYSVPNVLQLRMEDLIQNPYQQFLRIFSFLGVLGERRFTLKRSFFYNRVKQLRAISKGHISIPVAPTRVPVETLLGIVWANDFSKRTGGRQVGEEDQKSHYRKGVPGDWRSHFKPEHIDYFKKHYNHVLLKLGYEQDPDWA